MAWHGIGQRLVPARRNFYHFSKDYKDIRSRVPCVVRYSVNFGPIVLSMECETEVQQSRRRRHEHRVSQRLETFDSCCGSRNERGGTEPNTWAPGMDDAIPSRWIIWNLAPAHGSSNNIVTNFIAILHNYRRRQKRFYFFFFDNEYTIPFD